MEARLNKEIASPKISFDSIAEIARKSIDDFSIKNINLRRIYYSGKTVIVWEYAEVHAHEGDKGYTKILQNGMRIQAL